MDSYVKQIWIVLWKKTYTNRKHKDYVNGRCYYRSTWKKKKEYLRSKDKAKNSMMCQDMYNCICQNTKKMKIYYPVCQTHSPTDV